MFGDFFSFISGSAEGSRDQPVEHGVQHLRLLMQGSIAAIIAEAGMAQGHSHVGGCDAPRKILADFCEAVRGGRRGGQRVFVGRGGGIGGRQQGAVARFGVGVALRPCQRGQGRVSFFMKKF